MNNYFLNKIRYSCLLSVCILILFLLILDKNEIFNIYFIVSYCNITLIIILFIHFFYDPYKFVKFDKDDNVENIYFYFFILDRDKNNYLLLEEKIGEHISKCNKCNLCKKYQNFKNKEKDEIDLYDIISNSKNKLFNIMNRILRGLKKNCKKNFVNNSYLLINLIFIYCMAINQKKYNIALNVELLFEIINSENEIYLEQYNLSLSQIKYTNSFFIKAKRVLNGIYKIFDEKQLDKKIKLFFELGEELEKLKYKKIKSNFNNIYNNSNNNIANIEGLPNCNNLLSICSFFYEELYNESYSNSGIFFRESPNLLEDLINNNYKNSKQITLEINILNFQIKIIRAGGIMNKYENNSFFDFFVLFLKKSKLVK